MARKSKLSQTGLVGKFKLKKVKNAQGFQDMTSIVYLALFVLLIILILSYYCHTLKPESQPCHIVKSRQATLTTGLHFLTIHPRKLSFFFSFFEVFSFLKFFHGIILNVFVKSLFGCLVLYFFMFGF